MRAVSTFFVANEIMEMARVPHITTVSGATMCTSTTCALAAGANANVCEPCGEHGDHARLDCAWLLRPYLLVVMRRI